MSFAQYRHLPRHAEIANLEHELADLRARNARLATWFVWVRTAFFVSCAALLALLVYAILRGSMELFAVSFLSLVLCAIAIVSYWGKRLMDVIPTERFPYPHRMHADFLKNAIAEREQRLEELKHDDRNP
jgi:hypothetical protein